MKEEKEENEEAVVVVDELKEDRGDIEHGCLWMMMIGRVSEAEVSAVGHHHRTPALPTTWWLIDRHIVPEAHS